MFFWFNVCDFWNYVIVWAGVVGSIVVIIGNWIFILQIFTPTFIEHLLITHDRKLFVNVTSLYYKI